MIQTIPENEFMQVSPLWREYAASHECYDRAYTLRPLSDEELLIYLSSEWAAGGHHLCGYYDKGEIVAFIHYATADLPYPHVSMLHAEILDVYVSHGYRRRGIARELVGWVTNALSAKRIGRIHVRMSADNDAAIAFWRKSGFSDFVLTMKYQTEPSDASQP